MDFLRKQIQEFIELVGVVGNYIDLASNEEYTWEVSWEKAQMLSGQLEETGIPCCLPDLAIDPESNLRYFHECLNEVIKEYRPVLDLQINVLTPDQRSFINLDREARSVAYASCISDTVKAHILREIHVKKALRLDLDGVLDLGDNLHSGDPEEVVHFVIHRFTSALEDIFNKECEGWIQTG